MEEESLERARGWKRLFRSLRSSLVFTKRTKNFNRFFFLPRYNRALKMWFGVGAAVGLLVSVVSVWVLVCQVVLSVQSLFSMNSSKASIFTPAVPGMNLPWSHLLYVVLATALAVVFHELGHALSAGSEGVPTDHVAVFLVLCFPGAYVALSQHALDLLPLWSSLRIYCAGVWHNVVVRIYCTAVNSELQASQLCVGCWLLLKVLPFLVFPLYMHGLGVTVNGVSPQSPVEGYIVVGDSIKAINDVPVHSINELVLQLQNSSQLGYCVPLDRVRNTGFKCDGTALQFQSLDSSGVGCFNATDILKLPICDSTKSCSKIMSECMVPSVPPGEALMRISFASSENCALLSPESLKGSQCEKTIHFAGRPEAFLYSLQLTDYARRHNLLPKYLPSILEKFLAYAINISAALALVNSAPVYFLDGEEILRSSLRLLPLYQRKKTLRKCLTAGTMMFVLGMCLCVILTFKPLP